MKVKAQIRFIKPDPESDPIKIPDPEFDSLIRLQIYLTDIARSLAEAMWKGDEVHVIIKGKKTDE